LKRLTNTRYTRNQILNILVPPASGYKFKTINAGEVENSGIEFVISGSPIKLRLSAGMWP